MKHSIIFIVILITFPFLTISAQELVDTSILNSKNKSTWSISFSYSPHCAFSFTPKDDSKLYRFFLQGFNGKIDRKTDSERVSFSFGINFRKKDIVDYDHDNQQKVRILEFPFQFNYHLKKSINKYDPYIKSSIRLSYFKIMYFYDSEPGVIYLPERADYLPFIDIGFGSFNKINKKIDLLFESNLGYGITDAFPNRLYFDLLLGLKFKFN